MPGFPPWTTMKRAHRYVAEGQAEFVSFDPPLLRLIDEQQLRFQRRQQAADEQERRVLAGLAFHWFTTAGPDGTVGVHAKPGEVVR